LFIEQQKKLVEKVEFRSFRSLKSIHDSSFIIGIQILSIGPESEKKT